MWNRPAKPTAPVLLVIGAHRDELAFGERVSESLDPRRFSVLRIPQGISGKRPRPDQREAFRERHRALYLQILDYIEPEHRLLIDLHQGVDSGSLSADVMCADRDLLQRLCSTRSQPRGGQPACIRCVQLVGDTAKLDLTSAGKLSPLVAKPDIPEAVWNNAETRYVGLEIYLGREGAGSVEEQRFARFLVERVADHVLS